MNTEIKTVSDKQYQVTNTGTYYHIETNLQVIEVLEQCRLNNTRIRLFLGDTITGKVWPELHDVTGYVSRSTGVVKVPILRYNSIAVGGGAILDHCIMKISDTKGNVLYKAGNYKEPVIEIKGNEAQGIQVIYDNEPIANCKTLKEANKLKEQLL